jgi:hypothetical protein
MISHFLFIMENIKNIYVIKRKLSELKKRAGYNDYIYYVGQFIVHIYTNSIQDPGSLDPNDCITKYDKVDITLLESSKNNQNSTINLRDDSRFKSYRPIIYSFFDGPNGIVNFSDGREMPIINLCELIKYLHRLSNLTAFM